MNNLTGKIVNSDCVIDVLAAFVDECPLTPDSRKPVKVRDVLCLDALQIYSDEEKELAYRFLINQGYLELFIPPTTRSMLKGHPPTRMNRTFILQGSSRHHSISGVSPTGYELLKLASFPKVREKLSAYKLFATACSLLQAGKNAADLVPIILGSP